MTRPLCGRASSASGQYGGSHVGSPAYRQGIVRLEGGAPPVSRNELAVEAARLSLANIVLTLAKDNVADSEPLKAEAVRLFRLKRQISN